METLKQEVGKIVKSMLEEQVLVRDYRASLKASEMNLRRQLQRRATSTSADYVQKALSHVQSVDHKLEVHDAAIDQMTIGDGLILEFGVLTGRTINYIASKLPEQTVDGFDSFEGLPEAWRDGYDVGHFAQDHLPEVRENVRLFKGWFSETIPAYLQQLENPKAPVTYLHVDCDLYSSTKTVFELLGDRIVPGTVIVFDEYFNFDGWQNGEFKAFQEFCAEHRLRYEYITYNHMHEQVAVRCVGGNDANT